MGKLTLANFSVCDALIWHWLTSRAPANYTPHQPDLCRTFLLTSCPAFYRRNGPTLSLDPGLIGRDILLPLLNNQNLLCRTHRGSSVNPAAAILLTALGLHWLSQHSSDLYYFFSVTQSYPSLAASHDVYYSSAPVSLFSLHPI